MYIIQNAFKNLLRNKRHSLLTAVCTLAVLTASAAALSITNTSAKIINGAKLEIGSKADISLIDTYNTDGGMLTYEDFISYSKSDYLRETVYNAEVMIYSYTVTAVGDENRSQGTLDLEDGTAINFPTMTLIGNSYPNTLPDFGGRRYIVGGRMYENDNECIISSDLASLNKINAGDIIRVESIYSPIQEYELTVAGIYKDMTSPYDYDTYTWGAMPYINRRNQIITTFETVVSKEYSNGQGLYTKFEYYLKNPRLLKDFEKEVRSKGLPESYNVTIGNEAYENKIGPLDGARKTSAAFTITVLLLGAVLLTLISLTAGRARKYEIGVLRTMGMEKKKIAAGLISEAVIITVLCLLLGLVAGSFISQPIADTLLGDRVAEARNTGNISAISTIRVGLGIDTIIQMILISILTAAASGISGIIKVTRYEPMNIIMGRD